MRSRRNTRIPVAMLALLLAIGCAKSPSEPDGDDGTPGDSNPPPTGMPLNQTGAWMWASPTPQGSPVWRVRYASATTAYAVCDGGAVLKSVDAGATWEVAYRAFETQEQAHENLYGLCFLDADRGWVAGKSGRVSITSDGGATWTDRSIPTTGNVEDVFFHDAMNGFAVTSRGDIYRTDDGGVSWILVTDVTGRAGTASLNAITFTSADVGWIGGDEATVLHSDDGGDSWSAVNLNGSHDFTVCDPMASDGVMFGTDQGGVLHVRPSLNWSFILGRDVIMDVQFTDPDNGAVLYLEGSSYGVGRVTGGVWTHDLTPISNYTPNTLAWNGQHAVIAGWWGQMAHSADGGASWQGVGERLDEGPFSSSQLFDVAFANDTRGVAVGMDGVVVYTDDGGLTWTFGNSDVTETLDDVAIAEGGNAFAVGENGTALRSTDGGASWAPMTFPPITDPAFLAVSMWDDLNGIIVGGLRGVDNLETILVTSDGGDTWSFRDRNAGEASRTPFFTVWADEPGEAWIGGRNGVVAHTTDGGGTWLSHDTGSTRAIQSLNFFGDLGWAGTRSQQIYRTIDRGTTWEAQTAGSSFWEIHFGSPEVGVAVGPTGYAWGSMDGGDTWILQDAGWSGWGHIRSVWMSSPSNGVLVGTEMKIQYTRSAGFAP